MMQLEDKSAPKKAAIIGAGVIGGGWAVRFLLMGWDVCLYDPDADVARKIDEIMENARLSLPGLLGGAPKREGTLTFVATIEEAVSGAVWVQESVPERLEIKQATFSAIQKACASDAILASSTSGFKPSELQMGAENPRQIMVAHPFNPVYLLPLVELVTTPENAPALIKKAKNILTALAFYPLHIKKEIEAHIADRFLEAVWREALWLIKDDIATTEEIDDAIRYGFGLRWAQMGLFETYRIAGGEAGMRHFIAQFGAALQWPWTKLTDVPELSDALVERIATQSDAQSGARSIRELERVRDINLVAILRALKAQNWGAGAPLVRWEEAEKAKGLGAYRHALSAPCAVETLVQSVPLDWTDYNGHMNEARYLEAFSAATDQFMRLVGCDGEYIKTGGSYFTAETHIRHLDEAHAGQVIRAETLCLGAEGKKMHLFHSLYEGERLLATGEHMLIHVDLEARRASEPAAHIRERLDLIVKAHSAIPRPTGIGKAVGVKG